MRAPCLVVTTDEPTAITDAYAYIKMAALERLADGVRIVVNMVPSERDGERTYATLLRACREFLKIEPPLAGIIRRDDHVKDSDPPPGGAADASSQQRSRRRRRAHRPPPRRRAGTPLTMGDAAGIGRPLAAPTVTAPVPGAAAAPTVELAGPVPPLPPTNFVAAVIARNPDGTLLTRSAFGALALKTAQPLAPGTKVELRVVSTNPPTVTLQPLAPEEEQAGPPLQLDLGTTLTATVVAPAQGDSAASAGTKLLLRVAATPEGAGETAQSGTIASGAAGETLIESSIGTLALDRRLALPEGTQIAFARLEAMAPEAAEPAPAQASGLPALDQALAALQKSAPALAQQLHATLAPATAPALAGTLLFLMGALYRGAWPGEAIGRALTAGGQTGCVRNSAPTWPSSAVSARTPRPANGRC